MPRLHPVLPLTKADIQVILCIRAANDSLYTLPLLKSHHFLKESE